jgi:hypothetical protein
MGRIETGDEGRPEFEIWRPDGECMVAHVAVAAMGAQSAWVVMRSAGPHNEFLSVRADGGYQDCIYCGCPERVAAHCLLTRTDAEAALQMLLRGDELNPNWQWVRQQRTFERFAAEPARAPDCGGGDVVA